MYKKLIHIGTSGWSYWHWEEFYQGTLFQDRLPYFAQYFSTVEVNATFYRLPKETTIKNWYKNTPKKFIFAVKVNKYITHIKKLDDIKEPMELFLQRMAPLKQKLGPILLQLPPSLKINYDLLAECIADLPKDYAYVFEFRNATWLTDEILDLLKNHNIAFCINDFNGILSPLEVTAKFVYIRLHGSISAYRGSYSEQQLIEWASRILEWNSQKLPVFIFFNNDEKGYALYDAGRLQKLLSKKRSKSSR